MQLFVIILRNIGHVNSEMNRSVGTDINSYEFFGDN